jgi:hypothetical protein
MTPKGRFVKETAVGPGGVINQSAKTGLTMPLRQSMVVVRHKVKAPAEISPVRLHSIQ